MGTRKTRLHQVYGARAGIVADTLAEALVCHQECCSAGRLAGLAVESLGYTDASFLRSWAAGNFSA